MTFLANAIRLLSGAQTIWETPPCPLVTCHASPGLWNGMIQSWFPSFSSRLDVNARYLPFGAKAGFSWEPGPGVMILDSPVFRSRRRMVLLVVFSM